MRALRHRDFRLLWIGAFVSFIGSQIQMVGQGWLVYNLTGSEQKLAIVSFAAMIPIFVLGPAGGSLADLLNKRAVLITAQITYAAIALFLALATYFGFIEYWMIATAALMTGLVTAVETPTRQSLVSRVVPPKELSQAIPLNAMTFNLARVVGPAVGGFVLAKMGVPATYLLNALTFTALILAVTAIRSNLRSTHNGERPVLKDILFEGARYVMREPRLRTLFFLEATTSIFGIFYIALMPAIAAQFFGLGKEGLGNAYMAAGVGAFAALLTLTMIATRFVRGYLVAAAMTLVATGLLLLPVAGSAWLGFPILALLGFGSVVQFNTTNTMFQIISPDRLRGRTIAMHMWALGGLAPWGTLLFGSIAQFAGLRTALWLGGGVVALGAAFAWSQGSKLTDDVAKLSSGDGRAVHPSAEKVVR